MRGPALRLLAATLGVLVFVPSASDVSAAAGNWLSWDAAGRIARLTLVAGYNNENNGFNFDGYGRGKLLVRVPLGWRVAVTCRNAGSRRNSCAIVSGPQTITLAFPGAATPRPVPGLRSGQTARFTFTAARSGTYRIACLVPGHEEARMWDVLVIGGVTRPSISTRTGF